MDTYNIVLILIIYTAIILLVIFYGYPLLKKLFRWKISIQIGTTEKEVKEEVIPPKKQEEFPSVLGKSKFVLCQPLPNAATDLETQNAKKKGDTFAPETEKPSDETVNLETGEGVEVEEENEDVSDVDLNDEDESLAAGNISDEEASGIDYNNLGQTAKAVSNPTDSSEADEELAGKVLSENKYTELVKSMQNDRPDYAKRITELMDRHEQKLAEAQNQKVSASRKMQKFYESDDFTKFNVDDIS